MRRGICGIYKITSPTGGIYIGQSVDINERIRRYKTFKCKAQTKLYNSLIKHGFKNHKIEIIHLCSDIELNSLEKYYVDLFQTFNTNHGMNLRDGGGSHGRMSNESVQKVRIKNIGKKLSSEHKNKIRLSMLGKKSKEESKRKLSSSRKGMKFSKQHCTNIGLSKKGIKLTPEHKKKLSDALKGRMPKNIELLKSTLTGRKLSPESRKRMSDAAKRYNERKRKCI